MATTQIQLTDEQVKALERIAKAEGRSVAEVIESRIGAWFFNRHRFRQRIAKS